MRLIWRRALRGKQKMNQLYSLCGGRISGSGTRHGTEELAKLTTNNACRLFRWWPEVGPMSQAMPQEIVVEGR